MSELQIRINKRTLERALALIIIIVLAVLLINQSGGETNTEELEELQAQVADLTAQNEALSAEVNTLQTNLSNAQEEINSLEEAETQPESQSDPEPELSGELSFNYDASTTGDRLDRFTIVIDNGLSDNKELEVRVNWIGGEFSSFPDKKRDVFVRSGERETVVIDDLPSLVPDNVNTLRLQIFDGDNLIESDQITVF